MSTNYNAGLDSSDVVLSYGEEAVWGVTPAVAFKQVRMTGEGFSEKKTRTRPEEINPNGFEAHALTTQVMAEGSLNLAFSYATYDDLLAGMLNGDWTTQLAIDSTSNDIDVSVTLGGGAAHGFVSATAGKFSTVVAGQWIKASGFTNAANNGMFRVVSASALELIVASTSMVAEAPVTGTQTLRGSMLRNGTTVHTYTFQKQMAAALFFLFNGCYVSGGSLSASVGSYMEGSMSFLAKNGDKGTTSASTGAVVAAPAGRVIDTVAGFRRLEVNDVAIAAVAQSIEVQVNKNNARSQYGLGSADAQGMARGTLGVAGSMSIYFKDFTMYDLYKAETDQLVSFHALDDTGAGYVITIPAATLMNPTVVAGGPDTDVLSEFELEGNPGSGVYNNVVIQIDRFAAAA